MPITFHEKTGIFHIYNKEISYIMMILKNKQIGQLYYGKHIRDKEDFRYLLELKARPMAACSFPDDLTFSLEHIKQEYPTYGHGDFRHPAYEILQENGSRITNFTYQTHKVIKGKPKLEGLPATYCEHACEVDTLEVYLYDEVIQCEMKLTYSIYNDYPVLTRNTKFLSQNPSKLVLTQAMSASIDLPDSDFDMVMLTGAWAREREVRNRPLNHGIQSIYSMRGCSSNNYNPFLALKRKDTNEDRGEVYGFSFVYSGNFLAQVEVDTYDTSRIMMGIHPQGFSWPLMQEESFQTPEVVLVYSANGMNAMSQTFHRLYQKRLTRGIWRDRVRPILVNNWEGTYFNFDADKLVHMAKQAKKVGVELFVLDDGWFGQRNHDRAGLGDWYPNLGKLPEGINGLSKKIHALGMEFGLWFEPEMVNKDSDLYRKHPEWTLETPQRESCHGRHQYVLDFSRKVVIDYIFNLMNKVLEEASISYVKWDMNRCMSEVYSHASDAQHQGCVMHKYILGVYDLYERLVTKFPHILFESCASGGARFDPGMLYYAPQGWASDNTDGIERIKIQYGTSFVYPLSSIGSHVSAIPNHQVLRSTPLSTRANVAYFGTFGYELDMGKLTLAEQVTIQQQILFMKEYREVIQFGTFYRLMSPFDSNTSAWMVVSPDKKTAIVGYYRILQKVNVGYKRLRLQGLNEDYAYELLSTNEQHYGDELMYAGLQTSDASSGENKEKYNGENGDFQSRLYILKA